MSLSYALYRAQSSLTANAQQTAVVARNLAGANDPYYHRKQALQSSGAQGGARIMGVGRAMDAVLFVSKLAATSSTASQTEITEGLKRLEATVNDPELKQSLAAKLSKLTTALQQYAVTPDNALLGQEVMSKAKDMVQALNRASDITRKACEQADANMAEGVSDVRRLLSEFETVNSAIVKGTRENADVTDQLDTRDRLLSEIAERIGVHAETRGDNDMVIYTDSGVTLFETVPRSISMAQTPNLSSGAKGQAILIDGVAVTGPDAPMPIRSGMLYGASVFRDQTAVTYQRQIDEIARGLIQTFAETDRSGGSGAPKAGLFTYPGGPGLAQPGAATDGLAATIRLNATVDPAQGGVLTRLRDGGISGDPNYVANPSGAAGFAGRVQELLAGLNAPRAFDSAANLDQNTTLAGFASASVGWLQAQRKSSASVLEAEQARLQRTTQALSNATGVSVDEETMLQMELERGYGASAKLISVIDRMLNTLLQAV